MTPTEFIAVFVAVSGFISAMYTARTAASAAQQKLNTERIQAEADARAKRDKEVDDQFERLTAENARLAASNEHMAKQVNALRQENEELYSSVQELRRQVAERDVAVATLQRELAAEKGHRTALDAWVVLLVKAMTDAKIPIPQKPGTGPLVA